MTHEELQQTTEYWLTKMQLDLYNHIVAYMERNHLNRTQLAKILGVSKGYVTQLLNGDFDHRISTLIQIALKTGYAPTIEYKPLSRQRASSASQATKMPKVAAML